MGQTQQKSTTRPVVLILGGGYGGVTLAKMLDESGQCFVLLVDQKEFFFHTAASPRALARKHYAHSLLIPYDKLLRNGVVVHGVVQIISPRSVTLHGRVAPISFDFLVIATGAKYSFPFQLQERRVKTIAATAAEQQSSGAAECSSVAVQCHSAGDNAECEEEEESDSVPQPLFMMDTLQQYSAVQEQIAKARRIIIVGGGCVGIETAGELAAQYLSAARSGDAAAASVAPAVAPAPSVDASTIPSATNASSVAQPKEIILLHSRAELMNRQTGMRDKMRAMALAHLRNLGVQVVLQERADLHSLREVRDDAGALSDGAGADPPKSERSGECSKLLQSQGYLAAAPGCSLVLSTIKPTPEVDHSAAQSIADLQAAPAFELGGPHSADLVLLCTGVRYDPRLFEADPELRTCLDSRGRLVVNQFMQLEGSVALARAEESIARTTGTGGSGLAAPPSTLTRSGPGAESPLHSKFSFHYPHVFALGDCCVPASELGQSVSPQAYQAHRHAQRVAGNILNMLGGYALKPWEGAGPLSLFLSIGPDHGVSQLPNRQHALAGDAMTRLLKSGDMQVAANWAFLNQDPSRPSFKGHASEELAGPRPQAAPVKTQSQGSDASAQTKASSRVMTVVPPTRPPPTSPVGVHPLDSQAMSAQAQLVEEKLVAMRVASPPTTRLVVAVAPGAVLVPAPAASAALAKPSPAPSTSALASIPESQSSPVAVAAGRPASSQLLNVVVPPAEPMGTAAPAAATSGADDASASLCVDVGSPRALVASPCASSPIGPILLAGAQEDGFEAAMRAERDVIDEIDEAELQRQVAEQSVEQSVGPSVEQPVEQPAEQPVQQPIELAAEQPEEPAQRPAEQPVEQSAEQTAEQSVEQPLEQPVEQFAEQPEEQPVELSADSSIDAEVAADADADADADPTLTGASADLVQPNAIEFPKESASPAAASSADAAEVEVASPSVHPLRIEQDNDQLQQKHQLSPADRIDEVAEQPQHLDEEMDKSP